VRGWALSQWIDATEAREQALCDAADAADAALAAAAAAKAAALSRAADEEMVIAALPASPPASPAPSPRGWQLAAHSIDAAALLDAAAAASPALAATLPASPRKPQAAQATLAELCIAHPLICIGTGLLVFASQAAALTAGIAIGGALYDFPGPRAAQRLRYRLASLALDALTLAAGAAVVRAELRRCAVAPRLGAAVTISSLAGAAALAYALAFAAGLPGVDGADLAATVCTAFASLMVRRRHDDVS
jgi:hypothetical protein